MKAPWKFSMLFLPKTHLIKNYTYYSTSSWSYWNVFTSCIHMDLCSYPTPWYDLPWCPAVLPPHKEEYWHRARTNSVVSLNSKPTKHWHHFCVNKVSSANAISCWSNHILRQPLVVDWWIWVYNMLESIQNKQVSEENGPSAVTPFWTIKLNKMAVAEFSKLVSLCHFWSCLTKF